MAARKRSTAQRHPAEEAASLSAARIIACRAKPDYHLWLRFDDGIEGSVFLGNLLDIGAFKLWRDVREFEKVTVDPESATVIWEGGVRLCPDILYQDIKARGSSTSIAGKKRVVGSSLVARARSFEASQTVAQLAEIQDRLQGCDGLFAIARIAITDKIRRASTTHEKYADNQDLEESAAELRYSSKLGRAIEDLQAVRVSIAAIVGNLKRLTGEL